MCWFPADDAHRLSVRPEIAVGEKVILAAAAYFSTSVLDRCLLTLDEVPHG